MKNYLYLSISVVVLGALMQCKSIKQKGLPTTFYLAPQLTWTGNANGNELGHEEVVFIINPPSDKDTLLKLINEYNQELIASKGRIESEYVYFFRDFYRESQQTPRTFKEDPGGFHTDIIEDHRSDWIGSLMMDRDCKSCPKTWVFKKNKKFLRE
jgi:hypothetical protein